VALPPAFVQGGNSFGAAANLGTNDSNDLNLRTNGLSRITITANGSSATLASNMDLIMQGATAYITNSQGTNRGEAFGAGATTADDSVAVGHNASAYNVGVSVGSGATGTSTNAVAIGSLSNAGFLAVAIGTGAQSSQGSVAIGDSANSGAQDVVLVGRGAASNFNSSIALGSTATATATNQMVIGADGYEIDHIFVGSGVTDATPTGFTLQGTGGNGTNVAGANVTIAGGQGTGNAAGGNVNFQVAKPGATGTGVNALATVLALSGANGSALFKNSADSASAFDVQTAGGASVLKVNTANPGLAVTGNTTISGQGTPSDVALTVKGNSSQSGTNLIADFQRDNGDTLVRIAYNGGIYVGNAGAGIAGSVNIGNAAGNFGTLNASGLTGGHTLSLPNVDGTLCAAGQNCAVHLQDAYNLSGVSTISEIKLSSAHGGLDIQDADMSLGASANFLSLRGPNGAGLGNILVGFGMQGNLLMQPSTDRTDLIDVNNNAGNNIFTVDSATSTGRVGIALGGSTNPSYTLDVGGDINITSGSVYRINGAAVCSTSGCTAGSGSNNYIQNQNSSDQSADFRISGTGRANTSLLTPLVDTAVAAVLGVGTNNATAINLNQSTTVAASKTLTVTSALTSLTGATSGDALAVSNSTSTGNIAVFKDNATAVVTVGDGGAVLLQNETNQLNALKILTTAASGAHVLFNADAINERVGIGGVASASKFEVQGGDAAVYNNGNNPRLILGDSTSAGQNGYLQWDSTNDYIRLETAGTNGLKVNDNYIAIGNIFPDQPLKVANGANLLFQVSTTGAATLAGGLSADLSATAVATANGTGSALSIVGGNETSNTCGTACTGGALNLLGGSATGSSGTRNGGAVNIDAGTGNSANGGINIGTNTSANVVIGRTTGGSSATLHAGTGGVIIGDGGVANTLQIGNSTGAVAQTINMGTNATASSTTTVAIGSTVGTSTTTIQGGTGNVNLLSADLIQVGVSDTTATLFVLDTKTSSGDPTGVDGAMYYNSNSGKFRCKQAGAWSDCVAASGGFVSLQNAYTNSTGGTTSEVILDSTRGPLDVQDRSTSNGGTLGGNLLNLRATAANDSTAGSIVFSVGNTGNTTVAGNLSLTAAANRYISNPQGGSNSESFGNNATSSSDRTVVVGNSASATNNDAVAVGFGTTATNGSVAVGSQATCTNSGCVSVGGSATAGFGAVAIGSSASAANNNAVAINGVANNNGSIAINGTTTAANQLVIGGSSYGISQVVIGNAVTSATPTGFTLQGTSGNGTNIAGASTTIAGGQGTGTGVGGSVIIQASAAGGSGSGLNSLSTLATLAATGLTLGSSTLNTPVTIDGGTGTITVGQSSGTNTVSIASANFTAANTQTINIGNGSQTTAASTINVNILSGSAGNAGTARLNLANNDRVTQVDIGNVVADAARTLNVFSGASSTVDTINIGTGNTSTAGGKTIHIGDGTPTGTNLITIGAIAAVASTTTIQGGSGSGAVSIQAATSGTISVGTSNTNTITLGSATSTATITLGQSTASNTINIGNATTAAGNTQTINIGTSATSTGKATITIGNTNDGSALNLQAGTGNVNLLTNSSTASIVAKSGTNGNGAFKILDSGNNPFVTVNTSATDPGTYFSGTGTGGGGSKIFFGPVGDTALSIGEQGTTDTDIMELYALVGYSFEAGSNGDEVLGISQNGNIVAQPNNSFGGFTVVMPRATPGGSQNKQAFSVNPGDVDAGDAITAAPSVQIGNYYDDTTAALLYLDRAAYGTPDPTGTGGAMYYNVDTEGFRCYDTYWHYCMVSARNEFKYTNDFVGTAQDSVYQVIGSGTGAGGSSTAGSTGHPGQVTLTTGTTATGAGLAGANDGGTPFLFGNGDYWRFETDLKLPLLSNNDATNTYLVKAGMSDGGSGAPTDGCWFSYTHNVNTGKWQGNCANNSTTSTCNAVVTVAASTWYRLTIVFASDGSSVDFQVDGTSECQITTNIPTTAGRETSSNISILKTASTTARTLILDYVDIEGQLGTSR
jgi:hypothetical protein